MSFAAPERASGLDLKLRLIRRVVLRGQLVVVAVAFLNVCVCVCSR